MDKTKITKNEKTRWPARLFDAVARSVLGWLVTYDMGVSPREAQRFFNYSGLHGGRTMMSESLARIKADEGA